MREIDAKLVCETLGEVVHPTRAALLVVDVQNDYCTPGGALERDGGNISMTSAVVAEVAALVDTARSHGVPVVWIQQTWLDGGASDSPAWLYMKRRNGIRQERCVDGTWGHRFVDGLEPMPGEPVIRKHRSSGFIGTNLDLVLRSNRIETVIVVGVMSEGCVESTARDAAFHDYYVVLTPDAMASDILAWHEASVLTMSGRHDMVPWRTLVQLWEENQHDSDRTRRPEYAIGRSVATT
ncbi:MAG TPA: isochorismatase family cysteine hydrolase [Chloroflexota bacterium]|nr:isochorismatase family cysteine hydrolase [Chloroflexota bacterium]